MPRLITEKYYNKLTGVYNILDTINFVEFDHNFDGLRSRLNKIKRQEYNVNDRIIIEHHDTDYYNNKILRYGLNLYNVFTVIQELDMPCFVFLFFTNHFGLQQEVDAILKDHPSEDRPTIIETFITTSHYNSDLVEDLPVNAQDIKHAGLSMMGASRSHRYSLYNYLNTNNLLDSVKVSIRGWKDIGDGYILYRSD
tara:strand:- start:9029 stop:9616 length:588 start_codon:yes stop_codon:yes gene_type:complete